MEELNRQMNKKHIERQYLAADYDRNIGDKEGRSWCERRVDRGIEGDVLGAPTWIRDGQQERLSDARKK